MESSPTSSPCVLADNTLYCSAKAGFIPGSKGGTYASSVETQTRQTMRNLLDDLAQAKMSFSNVVATHVYLDDIRDADRLDRVYAQYFTARVPARTLIQPARPTNRVPDGRGHWPALEEISIIAVK